MRTFLYADMDGEHTITAADIIKEYFPYWQEQMKKVGKEDMISHERCIEDFCVVHWATEQRTRGPND